MRNVLLYYLVILIPFMLLSIAARFDWISSNEFVSLFALYLLVRQVTDAWRLVAVGAIDKVTWKVVANPLLQIHYFKALYWIKR
jgi:hypothetical protein